MSRTKITKFLISKDFFSYLDEIYKIRDLLAVPNNDQYLSPKTSPHGLSMPPNYVGWGWG